MEDTFPVLVHVTVEIGSVAAFVSKGLSQQTWTLKHSSCWAKSNFRKTKTYHLKFIGKVFKISILLNEFVALILYPVISHKSPPLLTEVPAKGDRSAPDSPSMHISVMSISGGFLIGKEN